MDEKPFPDSFWRGISNRDFICDGYVLPSAFQFDKEVREEDNFRELSINWNDSDQALVTILEQKKKDNGKHQFNGGAAKLSLITVKMFLSTFTDRNQFSYERRPVDGNEFHGNLLMSASLNKQSVALIANGLALAAGTNIVEQPNE